MGQGQLISLCSILIHEDIVKLRKMLSRADKKHSYKQLYFEIIDSIVGMLTERLKENSNVLHEEVVKRFFKKPRWLAFLYK